MGDRLVRKGLVIGIIALFIGVGVYPAIAVKLNTTINTVQDEKSNVDVKEQLLDLPCNCKKNITTSWKPPFICIFLFINMMFFCFNNYPYLCDLLGYLMGVYHCLES